MNLVVMPNRARLSRIAVGALMFVAAGVWFVARWANGTEGVMVAVLGLASISFFGLCGIYAFMRIVRRTPALVVDDRGITDNASAIGVGFIAWSEIEEMREYRFMNQTFMGVVPRDLEALLDRQPRWKRLVIRVNQLLGTLPVNIPQVILPMPISDLLQDIRACRDQPPHA